MMSLLVVCGAFLLRTVEAYSCVQYENSKMKNYYFNTCVQDGQDYPSYMSEWKFSGKYWTQFDCHNCNNASVAVPSLTQPLADKPAQNTSSNDLYPCCFYATAQSYHIESFIAVGFNPDPTPECPGTWDGVPLFGSIAGGMDSMRNCIAFEYAL
jgi:hypothetical protein